MTDPGSLVVPIPGWAWEAVADLPPLTSIDDRMQVVIDLARRNIGDGGGPFAAAVFRADGTIVAPGVNRVVASSSPVAHAEIVAISLAGQVLETWDLASHGPLELVTSTEPCAMCLGAVPWSGVARLVCGARDDDAREVGFEEGHKPTDWPGHLEGFGIEVVRDVRRADAAAVLADYVGGGGPLYNGAT